MNILCFNDQTVAELFPKRDANSHKGDFGTLVIIGGCEKYAGAPYLAALGASALRLGCGIVKIAVPEFLLPALQPRIIECTLFPLSSNDGYIKINQNEFCELTQKATAVICGMGIGNVSQTTEAVKYLLTHCNCPLLLDADALNAISDDENAVSERKCDLTITPHMGEMSSLTKLNIDYIKQNKIQVAQDFAKKHGITVLLKDSQSVITDGNRTAINKTGTPAMAKGGSGDLLAGIIGGLLARNIKPFDAAAAGAYIAGKSAEEALKYSNEYSLLPSDSAQCISTVITQIIKNGK